MDIPEMLIFKWQYSEKLTIEGMEWEVIEHENHFVEYRFPDRLSDYLSVEIDRSIPVLPDLLFKCINIAITTGICNPIIHLVVNRISFSRIKNTDSKYSWENISRQPVQPFAHLIFISGSVGWLLLFFFLFNKEVWRLPYKLERSVDTSLNIHTKLCQTWLEFITQLY
jgi:hypothetical protein